MDETELKQSLTMIDGLSPSFQKTLMKWAGVPEFKNKGTKISISPGEESITTESSNGRGAKGGHQYPKFEGQALGLAATEQVRTTHPFACPYLP
jgi:hypothetical protein